MRFGMGYGSWTEGFGMKEGRGFGRGRHGHDHHRGGGGGGGRGRRRLFDGGELKLVLLRLIADQPRHGYDLIREVEERTGGAYAPSPGVVYPTLTLLADMGLIEEAAEGGSRKAFAITEAGTAHLAENEADVVALFERLASLSAMREKTDGAPIRRAMGNMRQVLHNRLSRDDVDADTLHQVAAILDEAAQKIERL
ncbi:PadR family transcriptional regulator [Sphingomonas zeicaulis]|uniref:PadR family transcriptional regulator n=1 Tax=Sphingomonas zeicaulis TaxID=1632740 RepID=UPI003D1932B5